MSSLKDIMDVDVEPLESQAIQRSRDVALLQSQPVDHRQTSPSSRSDRDTQPSVKRKRPSRVTKLPSSAGSSRSGTARRRSSGATELMEPTGYGQGVSSAGSSNNNMRPSLPRGLETEPSIRYTPVTGRISRAKKGQPVHICDLCEEPRAFTRAEHLRRHQLSHQQARLPCTFQDCEKVFHRPDLLARHMNRHEIQGDGPFKASDSGRRSRSSSCSNPRTPPQKYSPTPSNMNPANSNYTSASIQASAAGSANMRMAGEYEPMMSPFQTVNVSNSSSQRPRSRTDGSESSGPQFSPPSGSMSSQNLSSSSNFHGIPMGTNMSSDFLLTPPSTLGPAFEQSSYESLTSTVYPSSGPSDSLPLLTLQVPDHAYPSSLAHTNSPPYNSSESTWSTPSDVSRQGTAWPRDRAISANWATTDSLVAAQQQQPQFLPQNMHMLRQQASLDIVPEHLDSSYVSHTRHFSSPVVLCQPMNENGGVEGSSDMYPGDGSQARDYSHSNAYGNFYSGL